MKSYKRIFSLLLAIAMVCTMLPHIPLEVVAESNKYYSETVVSMATEMVGGSWESNMCLAYIATIFKRSYGFSGSTYSSCCAYKNGSRYIVSSSLSDIPLGACVYFGGSSVKCSCGNYAGHVAVYVGDGNIVHAWGGKIVCTTIQYVIDRKYPYRGYGWYANQPLLDLHVNETYPSSGTIEVKSNSTYIKSLPCSEGSDANSKTIETACKGDSYQVLELVQNTFGNGNYWYKVQAKTGGTGYLYSGDATFKSYDYGTITFTGVSAPTEIVQGNPFSIKGLLTSSKLPLLLVGAYVYTETGPNTTKLHLKHEDYNISGKTYQLYNSPVDSNLKFNDLVVGEYKYNVGAAVYAYSADGNQLSNPSVKTWDRLHISSFSVVEKTTTCSHSYSGTVTTSPTCTSTGMKTYTCSKCGNQYTETLSKVAHTYSNGTCTVCGASRSTSTTFNPIWPLNNAHIVSGLDYYSGGGSHNGIDVNPDSSSYNYQNVYSIADGTVVEARNKCTHENQGASHACPDTWGNYVCIKHTVNGVTYYSVYAHLKYDSIVVSSGSTVSAGTKIAQMGSSGGSTGHHLHFEVWQGGRSDRSDGRNANSFDFYINNPSALQGLKFKSGLGSTSTRYKSWIKSNCTLSGSYYVYSKQTSITFNANGGTLPGAVLSSSVDRVNDGRPGESLVIFNQSGTQPGTNTYGKEVAVDAQGKITAVREYGDSTQLAVPTGGFILSGQQGWDSSAGVSTGGAMFVKQIIEMDEAYISFDADSKTVKVFDSYAGYLAETKCGMDGSTLGVLPVPTRNGYAFNGWVDENGNIVNYYSEFSSDYLTASWSKEDSMQPASTMEYGGHYYELYDQNVSWTEAKRLCEEKGGYLVAITTSSEQSAVANLIKAGTRGLYRIGATDAASEGTWKWVSGETFSYNNWDASLPEPSNKVGENYANIIGIDNPPNKAVGEWVDDLNVTYGNFYDISNTGFVCEYDQIGCKHSYTSSAVAPTCTAQGYTTYTCTACGDTYKGNYINPIGHIYQNGRCTVCGASSVCIVSGTCGANLTWELDDAGILTISGIGAMADYSNSIAPWYSYRPDLITVVVEEGVTTISDSAFENNYNVTDVSLPSSLTTIGNRAFATCYDLSSITIPGSVTAIGDYAFLNCESLNDVAIANGVDVIGYGAFYECTSLTSITIPDSINTIGDHAFDSCTSLSSVTIPSGVTTISDWTFGYCTGLSNITISDSVAAVGNYAFWRCDNLTNVYYTGSQSKWQQISVSTNNECLTNAIIHYLWNHKHTYNSVVTEPTCTAQGYTTYTCTTCGDFCTGSVVSALGHNLGQCIVIEEATCTYEGSQRSDCIRCDYFKTEAIKAMGHNYIAYGIGATCTTEGYTVYVCDNCGDSYTDSTVAALGHDMGQWTVTNEATCTEDGSRRRDCARCDHFETEAIAATGHNYSSVVTAPTCTAEGYTTHTCAKCGDNYIDTPVAARGHNMGQWTVVDAATCTEDGSQRRDCGRCDHFETEVIAATGHSYSSVVTASTCTAEGYTTHTCSKCGDSYKDTYVDATGHNYVNGACNVCGDSLAVTGITIKTNLNKTEYLVGESLDTTGLTVTVTYSNGSTQDVTEGFTVTGFDSQIAGTKTLTVTYKGMSATVTIMVKDAPVAGDAFQIVLESKQVASGSTFAVSAYIKNNPGFAYLEVTPVIPPELTLVKVQNGELISDFTKGKQYLWIADENVTEDGLLMTFTFAVDESVELGSYQVDFRLQLCADFSETELQPAIVPAVIEVIDFIYGDANNDGKVSGMDIIRLKRYLADLDYETGESSVEIFPGADANGDGKVSGMDIIRLKRYLADLDYETGKSSVVLGPQQ